MINLFQEELVSDQKRTSLWIEQEESSFGLSWIEQVRASYTAANVPGRDALTMRRANKGEFSMLHL